MMLRFKKGGLADADAGKVFGIGRFRFFLRFAVVMCGVASFWFLELKSGIPGILDCISLASAAIAWWVLLYRADTQAWFDAMKDVRTGVVALFFAYGITYGKLCRFADFHPSITKSVAMLLAFLCFVFVWCMIRVFLKAFHDTVLRAGVSLCRTEIYVYAAVLAAMAAMFFVVCCRSELFRSPFIAVDSIYYFDSSVMIRDHTWITAVATENQVHQPLFGIFAAPFAAPAYALSSLFSLDGACLVAMLMFVQAVLILAGNVLLGTAMGLEGASRMGWVLFTCCCSQFLLFSLCIEQYAVGFFWLALVLCLLSKGERVGWLAVLGMFGTMVLSGVVFLFLPEVRDVLDKRFRDVFRYAAVKVAFFVQVSFLFFRFDLVCDFVKAVSWRMDFMGVFRDSYVPFGTRILLFFDMIQACFAVPASDAYVVPGIIDTPFDALAWRVLPESRDLAAVFGIVLFIVALFGAWVCRGQLWARIAVFWLLVGVILAGILGYGSTEGDMTIYALYLCWPYPMLICGLFRRAVSVCRNYCVIFFAACCVTMCVFLIYNAWCVYDIVCFAIRQLIPYEGRLWICGTVFPVIYALRG